MLNIFDKVEKLNLEAEKEREILVENFEHKYKEICKEYKQYRQREGLTKDANKKYSELIGFHKAMTIILGEEETSNLVSEWYKEVMYKKEVN